MKKKIMTKWVKALRSGKYKQCREKLCSVDGKTGEESYCCLGVLTDLYLKERKRQKKGHGIEGFFTYTKEDFDYDGDFSKWEVATEEDNFSDGILPLEVAKWAGFNTSTNDYRTGCFTVNKKEITLADLNDGLVDIETGLKKKKPYSFNYIANVIEKNYEHI